SVCCGYTGYARAVILKRFVFFVPTVVVITFTLTESCSCPQRLTSTTGLMTDLATVTTRFFWAVFTLTAAQTFPAGTVSAEPHATAANAFLMPPGKQRFLRGL